MKKIRLYYITADAEVANRYDQMRRYMGWLSWRPLPSDGPLLDGPANHRLVVEDKDPKTRKKTAPIALRPPTKRGVVSFDFDPRKKSDALSLLKVSVFTTALKTIELFEEPEAIGRRIEWAFGEFPLRLVPRAGRGKNASYNRHRRSLRFFYFKQRGDSKKQVLTAGSPDIVAHETAHAMLDGIAPYLYDSSTPHTRSLHEAVADLSAAFFTFAIKELASRILERTGGDLTQANEFGWIGEQFGTELSEKGGSPYLRTLYSKNSIDQNSSHSVNTHEPHDLSTVFSGAVFAALITSYEAHRKILENKMSPKAAAVQALWFNAQIMRRILYRAMDYLPHADVNLLDVARAMISTDIAAFPDPDEAEQREALIDEFIERGIGYKRQDFMPDAITGPNPFISVDLTALVEDSAALEGFVNEHRDFLQIPLNTALLYCNCQFAEKLYIRKGNIRKTLPEWIIKISWADYTDTKDLEGLPDKLRILRGSTIVLDADSQDIKMQLNTNPALEKNSNSVETHAEIGRQQFLRGLIENKRFTFDSEANDEDAYRAKKVRAVIDEETGAFHLKGSGEFMHSWAHE